MPVTNLTKSSSKRLTGEQINYSLYNVEHFLQICSDDSQDKIKMKKLKLTNKRLEFEIQDLKSEFKKRSEGQNREIASYRGIIKTLMKNYGRNVSSNLTD